MHGLAAAIVLAVLHGRCLCESVSCAAVGVAVVGVARCGLGDALSWFAELGQAQHACSC